MLTLPRTVRVFVAVEPIDMRGSFDALAGAVRRLGLDPVDGHLYLFLNKRRRIAKALWFDGSGWCVKRLESGSFQLPPVDGKQSQVTIDGSTFASLLAGIDFTAARRGWYRRLVSIWADWGSTRIPRRDLYWRVVENEALRRENAELRALVSKLTEQLAKLNERVAELLAIAQRRQRKPAVEKPPAPAPHVDNHAKEAFDARPKAPQKPTEAAQTKAPHKPTGRKPVPTHLEAEEHALRPTACAHCGSTTLDVADEIVEEKLHVVKEHQRRRVVRRTTCRCRNCGGRTTPRSLPSPYERSKVTCEWLGWLVYQKFALLTPLDRVRRDLWSAACRSP